ncbi:MAG: putative DNA binding domain-containing protein [Eubacteriales bacterium]|nr:putative DNA binding domain-containing protein [Eubacteriales bacterium]
MLYESESIELKEIFTDDINREVVAFANTDGGTIYVGVDDNGYETGIKNLDKTCPRLTNILRDTIVPDITIFTKYELLKNNIIKITVAEGTAKPYYLKKNGMKPSGVFVRQGTSSVGATWEQIRQFIKHSDGDSFESSRSILQNLTFVSAEVEFKSRNTVFTEDNFISLGIRDTEKDLFTNLALILSDQCLHSVKVAVFDDPANTIFIDRREFTGSIFKQLHATYDYLMLNNRTVSTINGLYRTDNIDYPPEAIREALLNALIHRDYSYSGSIIININKEHIEMISIGGLPPGLSANDIKTGISQPRNSKLAGVFFRLKHIEAYGTGIRRIFNLYLNCDRKPEIAVSENTFRIILPNMNFHSEDRERGSYVSENKTDSRLRKITAQMQKVLDYLSEYESINDEKMMELLNLKRTRAYIVSRQMADMKLIDIIGRGKDKKFVLHK